jgi:hypothetical protein
MIQIKRNLSEYLHRSYQENEDFYQVPIDEQNFFVEDESVHENGNSLIIYHFLLSLILKYFN